MLLKSLQDWLTGAEKSLMLYDEDPNQNTSQLKVTI